jgi:hypothetical protein
MAKAKTELIWYRARCRAQDGEPMVRGTIDKGLQTKKPA